MTTPPAPQAPPQPSSATPEQIAQHDAAAQAAEAALMAATAGLTAAGFFGAVSAAKRLWLKTFGNTRDRQSGPEFRRLVRRLADDLPRPRADMADTIRKGLDDAWALGVRQGFLEAGRTPVVLQVHADTGDILDVVRALDEHITGSAQGLTHTYSGSWSTVENQVRPAQSAANTLSRDVVTQFHTNLNGGINAVADDVGAQLLWIAERDACATCLALSGQVVSPGESFDLHASFAAKPTAWTPPDGLLLTPPRHFHCRCRCTPWFGSADGVGPDFPDALRREAERSILRGDRLPSEPESVRLTAADRLLGRIGSATHSRSPSGWAVPKTVKERASRAVKRGHFTR